MWDPVLTEARELTSQSSFEVLYFSLFLVLTLEPRALYAKGMLCLELLLSPEDTGDSMGVD